MSRIDQLLTSFRRHVSLPLRPGLPLSQRVWFVVYPPEDERRLGPRLPEFEIATKDAGLGWCRIDLAGTFTEWLDGRDDRDEIVGDPELIENYAEADYSAFLKERLGAALTSVASEASDRTVFALTGLMELFDFVHVSGVIDVLDKTFPGVLLVFFPGERELNSYQFLGVRQGWDYLALPILPEP